MTKIPPTRTIMILASGPLRNSGQLTLWESPERESAHVSGLAGERGQSDGGSGGLVGDGCVVAAGGVGGGLVAA
jgi:hypothetical protein